MNSSKITVLIPAHNEALTIAQTLSSLMPQLISGDRVVVVADNCSDSTAAIARQFDVTVLEREDSTRLGKGYALDFGIQFLKSDAPSTVVLIDADCIVHPQTVQQLAKVALASGRPVQATYLQDCPQNPTPKDTISALAILVKNHVRLKGLARLSLPCLLYGTGMAFPWSVISSVSLANANLVEDMQLAIDLAISGYPPLYCSDAKVTGILPQEQQTAKTQRTRWEHGHLQTLMTQVPRLLKAAVKQRRWGLLVLALDLGVPPLSLLVMFWLAAMVTALVLWIFSGAWVSALILGIGGLFILTSIVGSWIKFGRGLIPGSVLLNIPFYVLSKIPMYLAFVFKPQKEWIKTKRDNFSEAKS
ncbi:glycosyltransferase family 2 protein [Waterburya agarophytonicola]|uniref:glycosyltransferase family 2 protein n=1 Tax=Waterburya agarophytonicola TaxID=2886916 RepID=UPI001E632A67|nr:glycosyltransferase family 2 protein [Waterburya agarophytonicola]